MRILYLSPWFPHPLDAGFRIRVFHLLKGLAKKHNVTLVTLNPQGWAEPQLEPVRPFCQKLHIVPEDPFDRSSARMATRFLRFSPAVAAPYRSVTDLLEQLHQEHAFDVVIAASYLTAESVRNFSGVTTILEEHNSHSRWMHERFRAQTTLLQRMRCWVSWQKARIYESRMFPRFDLITMVSDLDASTARAQLTGETPRVKVIPNGVDTEVLEPRFNEKLESTLIYSGALSYQVNYEAMQYFLRDVFPRIVAKQPGVKLRITGSHNGANLKGLDLGERVTLTGFVEDIHSEVGRATVSIAPILSGGGTRLKILEAMALGTPVVSTSKGAEGLHVIHGENILIADNPEQFAEYTVTLLHDPALRQCLAEKARQLVEQKYDWAQIGEQFVQLVERTVERNWSLTNA